jgi:hypothetical protein
VSAAWFTWVQLDREFAVGLLDFQLSRCRRDAERVVVGSLEHHGCDFGNVNRDEVGVEKDWSFGVGHALGGSAWPAAGFRPGGAATQLCH